ncbi:MAG: HNH endonuclease signature motif containing protein, partial [Actinomycetes bacterium]
PVVLDPETARDLANAHLAARRAALVLLVGADGALDRLVRLPAPPPGGWTRHTLADTLRKRLPGLAALSVDGYTPTAAIGEHVRAAWPTCVGYDCPRTARRCDLDHEDPWPRGPTAVTNLTPKCRRHHQHKTLGLWKTHRQADGSIRWTTLLGTQVTASPEPLPGC